MSVRPPVPPIQTSNLTGIGKHPPPPPPKSPLRTRSGSTAAAATSAPAVTRRRGDGKLVALNLPTPLSALEPSARPVAETVHTRVGKDGNNNGSGARGGADGDAMPPPPMSPTAPNSPGATLAAMRRQTAELRPSYYARPASPLRLQSAKREAKKDRETKLKRPAMGDMRRESSLSRLSRRVSTVGADLTRRASSSSLNLRNSLRKSLRKSNSFGAGIRSIAGTGTGGGDKGISNVPPVPSVQAQKQKQGPGLGRRQSLVKMARRESAKLKGILKTSQPSNQAQTGTEIRTSTESGSCSGSEGARPVAPKKVGVSWHPPPRDLERRQSLTKLRSIMKPNPKLSAAVPAAISRKSPIPLSSTKPSHDSEAKPQSSAQGDGPSKQADRKSKEIVQQDKTSFDIVAPVPVAAAAGREQKQVQNTQSQVQEQAQDSVRPEAQVTTQGRDGRDIILEIEEKHLSAAEARRLIRQHNRDYFRSRIWDPALQRDFAGAFQLANEVSPGTVTEATTTQPQPQAEAPKHDSQQTLVGASASPDSNKDRDPWKRYESAADVEEWSRSVQTAMARLGEKISTEAKSDPAKFMKARRESAQLRAWVAAQRRTSEARLSAIAMGRIQPESPLEQAFVAELLRENEIKFKHSSNPMAEAEKLFQDYNSKKNSLLPHYVPFSRYPLLTPLEEIEAEAYQEGGTQEEEEAGQSQEASFTSFESDEKVQTIGGRRRQRRRRRFSVFDEKKAARRAGREYKSFSTSTQLDQLEMHEVRCCGLWKPKAFVDKIS